MKKFLLSLVLLSVLATGCTNVDTQLTIKKDKSASISAILNYEGDLSSNDATSRTILENYKQFLDDGYEINKDNSTIEAHKSVKNVIKDDLDLSSLGFVSSLPSGRFIDVNKNFFVTSYNVDMYLNLPKEAERVHLTDPSEVTNSGLKPEYLGYADQNSIISSQKPENANADFVANYENNLNTAPNSSEIAQTQNDENQYYLSDFGTKFSINVPALASFNNADTIEGTTYTWNIKKDTPTVIRFQYVVYSGFAIFFVLLVGIGLLVYVARRIIRHEALKRIGNENEINIKEL